MDTHGLMDREMTDLRSELIAILTKIYFSSERKGSLTEDMADAVLALLEKRK